MGWVYIIPTLAYMFLETVYLCVWVTNISRWEHNVKTHLCSYIGVTNKVSFKMSSQRHPAEEREAQLHVWYLWSFFVVRMKGWSVCVYIRVAANPPIQHGIKSWGTYSLQVTCWPDTKWKTPHLSQQHFSTKSNVITVKGIFGTDWQSNIGLSDKGCSVYMYVIHVFK